MKRKRSIYIRMLAMFMSILMLSSPFTSFASTELDNPDGTQAHMPENEGATYDNYPNAGKSDDSVTHPEDYEDDVASKDRIGTNSVNTGTTDTTGAEAPKVAGSHEISIPAIFVTVKYFSAVDGEAALKKSVQDYLATHVPTEEEIKASVKLISKESIKKNGTALAIDETHLTQRLREIDGYFLEDLLAGSGYGTAPNVLLSHLQTNQYADIYNSFYYQDIAKAFQKVGVGSAFTDAVVTDIDTLAESGLGNHKTVPVILIYGGFMNYFNKVNGTRMSSWKSFSDEFGSTAYKKTYASASDYQVNRTVMKSSEPYGSAADIAFNMTSAFTSIYYNKPANIEAAEGFGTFNMYSVGTDKNYYGRTYLMYGDEPTGIGGTAKFTFRIGSRSGSLVTDGGKQKFVTGTSLPNFSTAYGHFYLYLGGDDATHKTVMNSVREWTAEITMTNDYPANSNGTNPVMNYNVPYTIDKVRLYDVLKDQDVAFGLPNGCTISGSKITLHLTGEEMYDIVNGAKHIKVSVRPNYSAKPGAKAITTAAKFRVKVDNPRTNALVDANPMPINDKEDGYNTSASDKLAGYHYIEWHLQGDTSTIFIPNGPAIPFSNNSSESGSSSGTINPGNTGGFVIPVPTDPTISTDEDDEDDNVLDFGSDDTGKDDGVLNLSTKESNLDILKKNIHAPDASGKDRNGVINVTGDGYVLDYSEPYPTVKLANEIMPIVSGSYVSSTPWQFEGWNSLEAYAEIVGNEVGYIDVPSRDFSFDMWWAGDWSVLGGIPSTETIAVAVGASEYQVNASGFIHTERGITRHVKVVSTVTNGWGPTNLPCTLSGPHTTHEFGVAISSGGCTGHGGHHEEADCGHCGDHLVVDPPGCSYDEFGVCTQPSDDAQCSCNHTIVVYECNHSDIGYGYATGWASDNGIYRGVCKYEQYCPGWTRWSCRCGASGQLECFDQGEIDEGYTWVGTYGCMHGVWNMEHPKSATSIIEFDEYIEEASWKEITSSKLWVLSYSELGDIDTGLYSASYNGNSASNANVLGVMWRGAKGLVDGANDVGNNFGMAGHLFYTQLKEPTYSQTGAWLGSGPTINRYYFGDCTVNLNQVCDYRWTQGGGDATKYDDVLVGPGGYVSDHGHQTRGTTVHDEVVGPSSHHYRSGRELTGDLCQPGTLGKICTDSLNAWQVHNAEYYKANIVSDFLVLGLSQGISETNNCFQNAIADFYAVDIDEGIPMWGIEEEDKWRFNQIPGDGGTATKNLGILEHKCRGGTAGSLASGEFSCQTGDAPVIGGYIGVTNATISLQKYTAKGTYQKYDECVSGFFIQENLHGLNGGAEPSSGGCKFTAGALDKGFMNGAPYSQWLWPDNETRYRWNYSGYSSPPFHGQPGWEDLRSYEHVKGAVNTDDGKNHSDSSGYTWMHLIPNGRRGQDNTAGIYNNGVGTDWQGYWRHHYYTYVGDGIRQFACINKTYYGDYYLEHKSDINNQGLLSSLTGIASDGWNGHSDGSYYNIALAHSDIDLKNDAKNGAWSRSMKVDCVYMPFLQFDTPSVLTGATNTCVENYTERVNAIFAQGYVDAAGNSNVVNDVVIHDPISVEASQVIGNNYGAYAPGIKDTTGDDGRVYQRSDGSWYSIDDESQKANYCVVGNEFHVWVSSFGDFFDYAGRWTWPAATNALATGGNGASAYWSDIHGEPEEASDKYTGEQKVPGHDQDHDGRWLRHEQLRGFQDSMNTNTWIYDRFVKFNFPVTFKDASGKQIAVGANTLINLDSVPCYTASGSISHTAKKSADGVTLNDTGWTGDNPYHYGADSLQNARDDDEEFVYGLDFAFTVLPSALETQDGEVIVYARAINDDNTAEEIVNGEFDQILNRERKENYAAPSVVSKTMNIEIVGRIGNLALTDVGDFRYSTLFKKAIANDWLINGVIENVDKTKPNMILSTRYDIIGNDTTTSTQYTHGTMSATNWLMGGLNGGKSAIYKPKASSNQIKNATTMQLLPLTAAYNPVFEYQREQVKMGYQAYFDIETIGNYYGQNYKYGAAGANVNDREAIDRGPLSATDEDHRGNVMVITPKYFLYDYGPNTTPANRWTPVSLYYGQAGKRELFYNDGEVILGKDLTDIYIDLGDGVNNEKDRRVVTAAEQGLTRIVNADAIAHNNSSIAHSALEGEDFIGTAAQIVLDQFDRTFIGTNVLYGAVVASTTDGKGISMQGSAGQKLFDAQDNFTGLIYYKNTAGDAYERLQDIDFAQQSQRWYFSVGVPSSTYIAKAQPKSGQRWNQIEIQESHEDLLREHPWSTLVMFLEIKVTGDVWTLEYDAENANEDITVPLFPDDNLPDGWDEGKWGHDIDLELDYGKLPPGVHIDPKWQMVVCYDPESSSADDWSTSGTH